MWSRSPSDVKWPKSIIIKIRDCLQRGGEKTKKNNRVIDDDGNH